MTDKKPDPLVEAVAEAILVEHLQPRILTWRTVRESKRQQYRLMARAAIRVINDFEERRAASIIANRQSEGKL